MGGWGAVYRVVGSWAEWPPACIKPGRQAHWVMLWPSSLVAMDNLEWRERAARVEGWL